MAESYEVLARDRDRWKAGNEGLVAANAVLLKQLEYAREVEAALRALWIPARMAWLETKPDWKLRDDLDRAIRKAVTVLGATELAHKRDSAK